MRHLHRLADWIELHIASVVTAMVATVALMIGAAAVQSATDKTYDDAPPRTPTTSGARP